MKFITYISGLVVLGGVIEALPQVIVDPGRGTLTLPGGDSGYTFTIPGYSFPSDTVGRSATIISVTIGEPTTFPATTSSSTSSSTKPTSTLTPTPTLTTTLTTTTTVVTPTPTTKSTTSSISTTTPVVTPTTKSTTSSSTPITTPVVTPTTKSTTSSSTPTTTPVVIPTTKSTISSTSSTKPSTTPIKTTPAPTPTSSSSSPTPILTPPPQTTTTSTPIPTFTPSPYNPYNTTCPLPTLLQITDYLSISGPGGSISLTLSYSSGYFSCPSPINGTMIESPPGTWNIGCDEDGLTTVRTDGSSWVGVEERFWCGGIVQSGNSQITLQVSGNTTQLSDYLSCDTDPDSQIQTCIQTVSPLLIPIKLYSPGAEIKYDPIDQSGNYLSQCVTLTDRNPVVTDTATCTTTPKVTTTVTYVVTQTVVINGK